MRDLRSIFPSSGISVQTLVTVAKPLRCWSPLERCRFVGRLHGQVGLPVTV